MIENFLTSILKICNKHIPEKKRGGKRGKNIPKDR